MDASATNIWILPQHAKTALKTVRHALLLVAQPVPLVSNLVLIQKLVDAQATNILMEVESARIASLIVSHVMTVLPARPAPLASIKSLTLRLVTVLVALTWILPLKHAKPVVLAVSPVQMLILVLPALVA